MDWELLETWGIEKDSEPKQICDTLEDLQLTLLQKRRNETDFAKKNEIADELKKIEVQLKQAKKEASNRQVEKKSEEEKAGHDVSAADRDAVPASDSRLQLQSGITEYRNGNYYAAFSLFNDLAQKGNAEAEYYLSQLYRKGHGTTEDKDRADFWLEKAADHKFAEAQYVYAGRLLSNRTGMDSLPKDGMQYLAKAADQDFQPALKQYVDIILMGYYELSAVKKAIKYSLKLQVLLSDQYEIEAYKRKEEQLKKILTDAKKSKYGAKALKVIGILSSVLLIFGFLYLLGGLHPDEWNNNARLNLLPDASIKLIIPFHLFWIFIPPIVTVNGKVGLEMITIAYACRSFYKAKQGTKIKGAFSAVSKFIIVAIIVWHLQLMIIERQLFMEGIIYFIIAIIVCRIFGFIIGKLMNVVSDSKTVVRGIIWTIVIMAILVGINIFMVNVPALNSVVDHWFVNKPKTDSNSLQTQNVITAEIVNDDVMGCKNVSVASISADSVLMSSSGKRYEAENMLDGDETTSWQEGIDGAGEGQTITVEFDADPQVDYIVIYNGNHESEKSYLNNNRICSMIISVDGQESEVELADSIDPQIIRLNGAQEVSQIQFKIVSVYNGNEYNDTCVAELQFLCE